MKVYRLILPVLISSVLPGVLRAQFLKTQSSRVVFFSDAPLEDIKATNTKARALVELESAEVAFEVPIQDFQFEKDLMKQHFNEKYMETEKFPKAQFAGKLTGFDKSKTGTQQVVAQGKLTIHGVAQDVKIPGTVETLANKSLRMRSKFTIKVADYNVKIPQIVWQNIAEEVEVTVEFLLYPK